MKTGTIRRALVATALLLMPLLLCSCFTLSINGLYDAESLARDDGLVGVWGDPEDPDGETWEFRALDGDSYRLVVRGQDTLRIDAERDGIFEAHLVRLGDRLFLDLYPEEPVTGNDFYKSHVVPAHSLWSYQRQGNVVLLGILENSYLEKAIESGEVVIDHVEHEGVLVLTAPTAGLQALVAAHADGLFPETETLQRLQ